MPLIISDYNIIYRFNVATGEDGAYLNDLFLIMMVI